LPDFCQKGFGFESLFSGNLFVFTTAIPPLLLLSHSFFAVSEMLKHSETLLCLLCVTPLACFSLCCKTCFTRFLLSTDGVTLHTRRRFATAFETHKRKYTNLFDNPGCKFLGHKMSQQLFFKVFGISGKYVVEILNSRAQQ